MLKSKVYIDVNTIDLYVNAVILALTEPELSIQATQQYKFAI